jgi:Protein of unknown function (DUF5132)
MALFDKGNILTGLAIGVGSAILGPVVIPALAGVAKPLAKAAIKGGLALYDRSKESFAEVYEMVDDLVAEARAEAEEEVPAEAGAAVGEKHKPGEKTKK